MCPPEALLVRTSLIYGGPEPGPQERFALDAADGVSDMAFFTDELRCPIAVADLAAAVLELAALEHRRPAPRRGRRRALAPRVRAASSARATGAIRRRCAASPAAPIGPSTSSSTARALGPCCACACAARARSWRREGGRRRRRRRRPHHRGAPARGGHRGERRRARRAAGHDVGRGRGALVPLPRPAGRARHGVVGGDLRRAGRPGRACPAAACACSRAPSGCARRGGSVVAGGGAVVRLARPRASGSKRRSRTCRSTCRGSSRAWGPSAARWRRDARHLDEVLAARRSWSTAPGSARASSPATTRSSPSAGRSSTSSSARRRRVAARPGRPARLLYVVPRAHVVLGGTAQEGDEDVAVDPATAAAIRARCEAAVPALRGARVLREAVGLRPARPAVRLETEARAGRSCIATGTAAPA